MTDWFATLGTFEKAFWLIAITASLVFIIILAMTLIGGDVDDTGDVDADIEGDAGIGFQFLSFKNLVGFFTIFGWSGISCMSMGLGPALSIFIATVCGLLMMFIMASIFYYLGKLTSDGSLKLKNAIDAVGEVYLSIGANRSKMGKVQVKIQGGLRELDALTDDDEDLKQGDIIKVTKMTSNGVLIVSKPNGGGKKKISLIVYD